MVEDSAVRKIRAGLYTVPHPIGTTVIWKFTTDKFSPQGWPICIWSFVIVSQDGIIGGGEAR